MCKAISSLLSFHQITLYLGFITSFFKVFFQRCRQVFANRFTTKVENTVDGSIEKRSWLYWPLTEWLKESRAISSTNHGIAQTRFPELSDSHLFLLLVLLTLPRLSVSAFWNINSYHILGHNLYCKTAISLTLTRVFVYHEEDFLEVATGVLRSVIDKLVSLQEPQVSY